jgi:predicted ABC-type ATPase
MADNGDDERTDSGTTRAFVSVSPRNAKDIRETIFGSAKPVQKYFFIAHGPRGSGKTNAFRELLKTFHIQMGDVVRISIDAVTRGVPGFTDAMTKIRSTIEAITTDFKDDALKMEAARKLVDMILGNASTIMCQQRGLQGPAKWAVLTKGLLLHYTDAKHSTLLQESSCMQYSERRRTHITKEWLKLEGTKNNGVTFDGLAERAMQTKRESLRTESGVDALCDSILDSALLNHYNITWETDEHSLEWTVKEIDRIKRMGYVIVLFYPWVGKAGVLRQRITASNEQKPPGHNRIIKQNMEKADANIERLSAYLDYIYIFDNSGAINDIKEIYHMHRTYDGSSNDTHPGVRISCEAKISTKELKRRQIPAKFSCDARVPKR